MTSEIDSNRFSIIYCIESIALGIQVMLVLAWAILASLASSPRLAFAKLYFPNQWKLLN
jgi:hypothetical protein